MKPSSAFPERRVWASSLSAVILGFYWLTLSPWNGFSQIVVRVESVEELIFATDVGSYSFFFTEILRIGLTH